MKRAKIFAALLASSMMLAPAMSVGAVNITVDGNAGQYEAYRLLDLTVSLKRGDSHEEGEHTANCYNYAYTVNPTYGDLLRGLEGMESADSDSNGEITDYELVKYIESLNSVSIRTFADSVWGAISVNESIEADATSDGKIITVGEQGYYLIVESASAEDPDSVSLVMLDTAGENDIKVTSKEDIPTLEKKVKGADSEDYVDAVDASRGETVEFKLTGSIPSNIDNYKTY